jgi:ferredoxin
MIDYQVAIPTYKRPDILVNQSLSTLDRGGVDRDRVTVFVANEQEREVYDAATNGDWRIEVSCPGKFCSLRYYVGEYYKKGTPLLSLDDDIRGIGELGRDGKLHDYEGDIDSIVDLGFRVCRKYGAPMWGMNPTPNPFWMKREISVGLRYIIGCFHGLYAGDKSVTGERLANWEAGDDHETTLRAWEVSRSLVRFEYLSPKTKYFADGGIDADWVRRGLVRQEQNDAKFHELARKWPSLCHVRIKAGNVPNLRFKSVTTARLSR